MQPAAPVHLLGGTAVAKAVSALNAAGVPVAGTSAGAAFITEHMIAFGDEGCTPVPAACAGRRAGPFMQRGQALAFVVDPLVEIPRHQLAAVQRGRLLALAGAHQLLEVQCVATQRTGCGTQAQSIGQHHHHAGHAGPQHFNQLCTGVGTIGRQRQACQQRSHCARRKPVQTLHAVENFHRTQKTHLPAGFDGG